MFNLLNTLKKNFSCQINLDKPEQGTAAFFFKNAMRGYEENPPIPYFPKKYTCKLSMSPPLG